MITRCPTCGHELAADQVAWHARFNAAIESDRAQLGDESDDEQLESSVGKGDEQ